MDSTAPAEEQRQPKVSSKVIEMSYFASVCHFAEDVYAASLSDAAKE